MVNYNGERYLEESLGCAISQRRENDEIIIVDNASEDKSLKLVKERFPEVKIIELGKNLGPSVARNVGFKVASFPYILFIDNDVLLGDNCLDSLLSALIGHPQAAVVMPRVIYASDRKTIQFDGADSHFLGTMTLHSSNTPLDSGTKEIKKLGTLVTACFLMDRRKWTNQDLFDETFFFNLEDYDFGFRTRLYGHEILAVPLAQCYHKEGTKGLSLRPGGKYSRMRVFCLIRNRWQILLKNYSLRTLVLLSPILFIYEAFQLVGIIKKGWFGEWLKAASWILLNILDIVRRRRIVQKERRVPDREILQNGPIPFSDDLSKSSLERKAVSALNLLAMSYWRHAVKLI
jgi:GT2 family glycosyltransferase